MHIFISYSKQNIEFARYLRQLLEKEGFAVWMDEARLEPSEDWFPSIEKNIVSCSAFMIIMSPASQGSRWVEREILIAEDEKKPIFPVLLEGKGWRRLGEIQHEDMSSGLNATLSPLLLRKLRQILNPTPEVKAPIPPAAPIQLDQIEIQPKLSALPPRFRAYTFPVVGIIVAIIIFAIVVLPALKPSTGSPTSEATIISSNTPELSLTPSKPAPTLSPSATPAKSPPVITSTSIPPSAEITNLSNRTGIIASLQAVNLRDAPNVNGNAIVALNPNTNVQLLATSADGKWFNIRIDGGREGWVAATLVRLDSGSNLQTTSPNLTALPTLPIIDVTAINQTATALALPPSPSGSMSGIGSEGNTNSQSGVDVLAYCDNKAFGRPAPTNLTSGSTIDVVWNWYTKDSVLIQQHLDNVIYDVKVDGKTLDNWREYTSSIRKQNDGNYYIYWYVPAGPLASGQHSITYKVSWKAQITDGYDNYGPGTNKLSESGSCTFTVK